MTDLEPIARAICKSRIVSDCDAACENGCRASSSALESSGRDAQARAAYLATLKAIRKPSDDANASGVNALWDVGLDGPDGVGFSDAETCFTAMIDRLIKEAGDE